MRYLILILLLIILGFISWKAVEKFQLFGPDHPATQGQATPTPQEESSAPAPIPSGPIAPSFDVVRVSDSGYASISGRGQPGATIIVHANEEELARDIVYDDGSWTINPDEPLDVGTIEFSLSMITKEGQLIRSEQTIVIYLPERGKRPLILRTSPGGATQILQSPTERGLEYGPLSLDSIDYDDSESVIFSGRAEANRTVEILANGQRVGVTNSNEDGQWTLTAAMAPGVYTLLIIQYDEERRRPAYAIELPFERASADQINLRDGKIVVQPGNSLWRIARRAYGSGAQYTIIYEANNDQIRDPDLIYPGQIFSVPSEDTNTQNAEDDDQ